MLEGDVTEEMDNTMDTLTERISCLTTDEGDYKCSTITEIGNLQEQVARMSTNENMMDAGEEDKPSGPITWYRVIIPDLMEVPKCIIINTLRDMTVCDFEYFNYCCDVRNMRKQFYIMDASAASKLMHLGKIEVNVLQGKLYRPIWVRSCAHPCFVLDDEAGGILKNTIFLLYDENSHLLNLYQFTRHTVLRRNGIYVDFNIPCILSRIMKFIGQEFPHMVSLDMSSNSISNLEGMKMFQSSSLESLDLSYNNITSIHELEKLRNLNLKNLNIKGNGILLGYMDNIQLLGRDLLKIFPDLVMLNEQLFTSGHNEGKHLMPCVQSFIPDEVSIMLKSFLDGYSSCFVDDRKKLGDIYSRDAVLKVLNTTSQASSFLTSASHHPLRSRVVLLRGKSEIVNFFQLFPQVAFMPYFNVDLISMQNKQFAVCLTGFIFMSQPTSQYCSYRRLFFCSISDSMLPQIIFDHFHLVNATLLQMIKYCFVPRTIPMPVEDKILGAFMKVSMMNVEYANMCLSKNDWDIERSIKDFFNLKNENRIPDEAFT